MNIVDGFLLLTLAIRFVTADDVWCYYCNWTSPNDVFKCMDPSAQCIRCNDPIKACIGKSCFRYIAGNGSYIVGCVEHSEQTRCEDTDIHGVKMKCYCSKNLCNSSDVDNVINSLLFLICLSLCSTIL